MNVRTLPRSTRGFTLVELLVVMGIIAILVAISMPVYTSAINHAKTAKCSSNLRNIAAGMITYAGDNNGKLPVSGSVIYHSSTASDSAKGSPTIDPTTLNSSWTEQLEPYLGASSPSAVNPIFQCPDWANAVNSATGQRFAAGSNPNQYYSYFNGAHAGGSGTGTIAFGAVNLLKIKAPSAHIIAGDIASSPFGMYDADPDDYGSNNPAFNGTILIHGGSVNIAFADGHVENVRSYDNTKMTTHYAGIVTSEGYTDSP